MPALTLEERVELLEAEVKQLKQPAEQKRELDKSDKTIPWWKHMVGIYADSPEFEEAIRFGKQWRESEDAIEDEDAA